MGYVKFNYHWGQLDLVGETGPDVWQTEFLTKLGEEVRKRSGGELKTALRMAVASGHGIGKTALVAWIIQWFMTTRSDPQIVVTANTQTQLDTKTWRELAKWHRRMLNRHWFQWTATKFYYVLRPETWYAKAQPWSESNPDAFAGTHEKEVIIIFDEASSIADCIWETANGAMTTPGAAWIAFGNPTRNDGQFARCFLPDSRWITWRVDSRLAKVANVVELNEWIKEYGIDSDFVRVRILGEFPRQSATQFISSEVVAIAKNRPASNTDYQHQRPIVGVDVAGFGGDQSVIIVRQGSFMHSAMKFRGIDTVDLCSRVLDTCRKFGAQSIACVDGVGMGAGVVDLLMRHHIHVIDVQSATKAVDYRTYSNKRAELWGRMRDWITYIGRIPPEDKELGDQLCSVQYGLNRRLQIQLQAKHELRKQKIGSPDVADALAYTFAYDEQVVFAKAARARTVKAVSWG